MSFLNASRKIKKEKKKKQPHKAVGTVWYPEGDEIWIPAVYEISNSNAYCS